MDCPDCSNTIRQGMEISLANGGADLRHCPYCLSVLPGRASRTLEPSWSEWRNVRVEAWAGDPVIKNDELALRYGHCFRCHHCCRDLAQLAYREEAYREERWLPVIAAVDASASDSRCVDCVYLGAVSTACQQALSCMPRPHPVQAKLLEALLVRSSWRLPQCDWSGSCDAVRQYRLRAAQGVALL